MGPDRPRRAPANRDEIFLELTKSICPACRRVLDAEVNIRDNRVILRKRCPEHGPRGCATARRHRCAA